MVLTRFLRAKLIELNPGLPDTAYEEAVHRIAGTAATQTMAATNREKYALLRDGVQVPFRNQKGERVRRRLRVFDFTEPAKNDFLRVREGLDEETLAVFDLLRKPDLSARERNGSIDPPHEP